MTVLQQMLQVQATFESQILSKPNVVGVAVGLKETEGVWTDTIALVALVERKLPLTALSAEARIPRQIDSIPTDVYEVGQLKALQLLPPTSRFRPTIPPGVSIGHFAITAGTLGAVVKDRITGEKLLLSNNHVFANSNDAQVGDSILQPGPADGGQNPGDAVATLERYVPLRYIEDADNPLPDPGNPTPTPNPQPGGCNAAVSALVALTNTIARIGGSDRRVVETASSQAATASAAVTAKAHAAVDNALDAALAKPNDPTAFSTDIRHIGTITGTKAPQIGMAVRKAGRTTDYTQSMITLLNATVNVGYVTVRGPRTARFTGQIIAQPFSQGGDSGSLVVDGAENKAVGLLFAGSAMATIFTPIDVVLAALNATF
ncbi:MAG: hypothetical protein J5J04_08110 [Anaerolineae bacterium]|jgi:hypothetical protein|nr:hypothetical protein [Chloroflexota bacterium]MBV6437373.1 hypothetical protein [Anaerolineae bacterium]MDL1917221.1 hypothetical protein [Anaerolineae bacterium CFX4]OQY83989.1 MAG: hypothetical protein B6D42_06290 [Anaerolineae bacterium UTCFX5]MBW7878112.1 hypothetical protein [Anaerolineae bacterium]